jgi:hypothetical protein
MEVGLSKLGQQPGQFLPAAPGQQSHNAISAQAADKLPQHTSKRSKRQALGAQL